MCACVAANPHHNSVDIYHCEAGIRMASMAAAHEPGIRPGSIPLADALVPASIFAPDRGGCGDDAEDECFEDRDMFNGELEDCGVDFTNKVYSARPCELTSVGAMAAPGDE